MISGIRNIQVQDTYVARKPEIRVPISEASWKDMLEKPRYFLSSTPSKCLVTYTT